MVRFYWLTCIRAFLRSRLQREMFCCGYSGESQHISFFIKETVYLKIINMKQVKSMNLSMFSNVLTS